MANTFVVCIKRLYDAGKLTEEQLQRLLVEGKITQEDMEYITQ